MSIYTTLLLLRTVEICRYRQSLHFLKLCKTESKCKGREGDGVGGGEGE